MSQRGIKIYDANRKNGKRLWSGLLDFIYPPHCLICDTFGQPAICPTCYAGFAPLPEPVCEVCGRPLSTQGSESNDSPVDLEARPITVLACRYCAVVSNNGGWGFDRAHVAGAYYGSLRHAIHQLKFNKREFLGDPLGEHMANRCMVDGLIPAEDMSRVSLVAAVPLHPSRERVRGFNQARLLARPVAEMHGVPLASPGMVRRIRKTHSQVGLSGTERMANMEAGMFAISKDVRGQGVLLVDDVMTTGATVSACARALKNAGASPVFVVALAAGA